MASLGGMAAFARGGAWTALALVTTALLAASHAPGASAAQSGEIVAGDPETVFDWSRDACEPNHIPDLPVRAFRDSEGRIQLLTAHFETRRMIGSSFDSLAVDCEPVMSSTRNDDPAAFDDREWIGSVRTENGRDVVALVHEEFQGHLRPTLCPLESYFPCWRNSLTIARSSDGGESFHQPPAPAHAVATMPYAYAPGAGPYGYMEPTNIVKHSDGYYYAMMLAEDYGAQNLGTCIMRTRAPEDPASWRAWNGTTYSVQFATPYVGSIGDPSQHVCKPVAPSQVGTMRDSLTYNTYFQKYMLVGSAVRWDQRQRRWVEGIYYTLSRDFVRWSGPKLIEEAQLVWRYDCGDTDPIAYPSIIDPSSASPSFATSGRRPYLYFTQHHYRDCGQTLDRDLMRVRLDLGA